MQQTEQQHDVCQCLAFSQTEDFNHRKFWCACATIMYRMHYAVYWDWFSQIEPVPVPIPLFLFTRQYYHFLLVELSIVYLQSLKFS